ncbi:hypothetical protein [Parasporobacterium paucivorans]|uniref:Uncharacterized protein n=1 Tax=Parasporobacterium paucivorans DSM 15970 TaxID=1122934 RepID=A0A1M6J0V3_9FIRM|nr:hypothetical protein [Parasporobacterium paucivorans]SHJ40295.1 hypothetical protein SAMN02745691_01889 [Parasporobacterium paucivorans DSM 15970]
MKVKYLGESDPVALINGKIYEATATEHNCYRVMDEEDEDYLYPTDAFELVEE